MTFIVPNPIPEDVGRALSEHDLSSTIFVHTNLIAEQCACWEHSPANVETLNSPGPSPNRAVGADGGTCFNCGGMTVRTGSCTECTNCFVSSGGCG